MNQPAAQAIFRTMVVVMLAPQPILAVADEAPELVFPVQSEYSIVSRFGEPRPGGRRHQGIDIAAAKLTPVVAAAPGVVAWLHDTPGGECCAVAIDHDNGWQTRYFHLNDDSPGSDDGQVVGIAEGVRPGARIDRGELIGWVGDSGNAASPHLHFELRRGDGTAVAPYPYLQRAPPAPGASQTSGQEASSPQGEVQPWRLVMVIALLALTLLLRWSTHGAD